MADIELDWDAILAKSKKRALGGGIAGAGAMVNLFYFSVFAFMSSFVFREFKFAGMLSLL